MRYWLAPLIVTLAELLQFPALIEGLNTERVVMFGVVTLVTGLTYGIALASWWLRQGRR